MRRMNGCIYRFLVREVGGWGKPRPQSPGTCGEYSLGQKDKYICPSALAQATDLVLVWSPELIVGFALGRVLHPRESEVPICHCDKVAGRRQH